jgi:hypothetical protein
MSEIVVMAACEASYPSVYRNLFDTFSQNLIVGKSQK